MNVFSSIFSASDFINFKKEAALGKMPKAILLISKDDVYSLNFAKALAMLILDGENLGEGENSQKVVVDSHPDVKVYPREEKFLVADSQDVVMESYIKPIFAESKVFIIKNIDLALDAPQNKLLKVLEEPPRNVYFILTCSSIEKVLPTIRSRCNKFELAKLGQTELAKYLTGSDPLEQELALSLADGQIGKLSSLCKNKNLAQVSDLAVGTLTELGNSRQVLGYSKKIMQFKEDFPLYIDVLTLALEDLIKIKSGNSGILRLSGYRRALESVTANYSVRSLCEITRILNEMLKEKTYNVNVTILLENFLMNILEVKYIWK